MKKLDFEAHYYSKNFLDAISGRTEIPIFDADRQWIYHGGDGFLPIKLILPKLLDLGERRISDMNQAGIDAAILSASIGVEQLPADKGAVYARDANDILHEAMRKYEGRFWGNAILAPADIDRAVTELERTRTELGFVGWNAFSNYGGRQLDDARFYPLLETAVHLGMYVYIHPTVSMNPQLHGYGPALVTSGFGFAFDVASAVVRLIFSGTFDRLPGLKVIIGHSGEALPFLIRRLDDASERLGFASGNKKNERLPSDYFKTNILITTSGNFSPQAFACAKDTFGIERMLFATDYPMEDAAKGVEFIEKIGLSDEEKAKLYSENAAECLGIS